MKKLASLILTLACCTCFIAAQDAKPTATPATVERNERPTKPTKEPQTPDEFYEAARWELSGNNDDDTAIILLGKAIAIDPALTNAYLLRGNLYSSQKKCQAAIADYTAVIEQFPDAPNTYQSRAECKIALKDLKGALLDLDASVSLFSAKGQMQYNAYFKRAKLNYLLKNYENAIADFNTIANNSRFADDTTVVFYRALTYMKKGDNDNAVADFKTLSDYYFSITAEIRQEYPEQYAEEKDYPLNENPLATLNKKDSGESEIIEVKTVKVGITAISVEAKCKDCPKVELANFEDMIHPDEWFYSEKKTYINLSAADNAEVFFYFLGNILEQKGDAAGAIEAFTNSIIAKRYDSALLYFKRGKLRLQREDFEPAVKDFSWAISQDRRNADAYLERGIAIVMLGHDALAQKDFDIYQALDKTPAAKENLAKRLAEAKKKQREKANQNKVVQSAPKAAGKANQPK